MAKRLWTAKGPSRLGLAGNRLRVRFRGERFLGLVVGQVVSSFVFKLPILTHTSTTPSDW